MKSDVKGSLWLLAFMVCLVAMIVCGFVFLFLVSTLGDGDVLLKLVFAPFMLLGVVVGWVSAGECYEEAIGRHRK